MNPEEGQEPKTRDITSAVAKAQRPMSRDRWLALGGWPHQGTLVGEHLHTRLRENA